MDKDRTEALVQSFMDAPSDKDRIALLLQSIGDKDRIEEVVQSVVSCAKPGEKDRVEASIRSMISAASTSSVSIWGDSTPRPWMRFLARSIDMGLVSPLFIFYWPLEAFLLSYFGTTPGKWFLGVNVRRSDHRKPTFQEAWARSWRVWVKGVGLSIPVINLVSMSLAYNRLTRTGTTSWDSDAGFVVTHRPVSLRHGFCAFSILVIVGLYQIGSSYNFMQQIGGWQAMNKGNYDQALKELNSQISSNPTDPDGFYDRGTLYYKLGKYQDSLNDLNKAISLDSSQDAYFANRASTYIKLGKFDLAHSDIESEAKLGGWLLRGKVCTDLNNLGTALWQANNSAQALTIFNEAAGVDPNSAMTFLNRGGLYNQMQQYPQALSDSSQAIKLDPKLADAYFNRSVAEAKLGQTDLANQDLAKSKALKPAAQ